MWREASCRRVFKLVVTAPRNSTIRAPMKINLFNKDAQAERFPAGQVVFREGDRGDHMFAVIKGAVDIIINGKMVETVEAGGVFGEMALVEDQPRVASAVVRSDAELVLVDRKCFMFLVQQTPYFSLQLMAIIAERLRRMNEKL
jgi:CRP/FNR family cyclic AMP-dependent transcriptional regulator